MTKNRMSQQLPQDTLETLARTFFKEASGYGFSQLDYVRFVNILLDLSIRNEHQRRARPPTIARETGSSSQIAENVGLPCCGERVCVREFNPDHDKPLLQSWLTDEHGRYFLLSCATAEVEDCQKLVYDKANTFGIISLRNGAPIGAIVFLGVSKSQRKAELRKLIGVPSMRGLGLAKEATRLWIDYGMSTLRLNKIYVHTLDTNLRNIRLNESLGFKVEGILRNEVVVDGKFRDVLRMGLCREL
jgi:RimJ/RimL family protein N-acetyltransferase